MAVVNNAKMRFGNAVNGCYHTLFLAIIHKHKVIRHLSHSVAFGQHLAQNLLQLNRFELLPSIG